jgi:hypothetical protein
MFFRIPILIFTLFFCMLSQNLLGQKTTQFASDTGKFVKDFGTYFVEGTVNKEQAQDFVKSFEKLWTTNFIAGYFKQVSIKTANAMIAKKMKPYPYFYAYFNAMINAINSGQTGDNFENWQQCVNKILSLKSNRGVQEFFEMSESLFKDNTFFQTPAYNFHSKEANFSFEYDSLPRVLFENITLIGVNPRKDSIAIEETNGIFYPTNGKFVGKGGKVSWERCGLDASVFAGLKRYTIDCKVGNYTSDSATFYGKQFFDKPQVGRVSDRIITEHSEKSYPRFDSYSKRLVVKNIYPDVDYDGGFGMRGAKFVGSGSAANPARIVFKNNDVKFLEISARAFGMSKDKIAANPGVVKFFLDKDTIYHPGLSFTYQVEKRLVTILRGEDGLQKTPFLNSYHKYDMSFEQILWQIDEPQMAFDFLPNNLQGEAYFESMDFFTSSKADAIKGEESISPISKMIEYHYSLGKALSFSVIDFAKYIKYLANDLRPMIFKMAIYGLIYFDPESDMITIRQRLFDYADNLKHKHDYDIITLHSVTGGQDNATMNLLNFDINVHGVKQVLLSDTQKVFMFPKNGEITLKKNRRMEFSGTLASGKFEFIGKDFVFDYEQFKVQT